MLFSVTNNKYLSPDELRTETMLNAYFIIKNYPLKASDTLLDEYLQQHYKITLKDLCIKLLLSLTFYKDDSGNLVLLFKNPRDDAMARLITYGTGPVIGSQILKLALNS